MPTMSAEEYKAAARLFLDELYNKGNYAMVLEQLEPSFVYHTATPPFTPDREGVIEEAKMLRSAFPDLRLDIDDLLVEGDEMAVRYTVQGTHEGDFIGIAPTHKRVLWSGISIDHSVNGKSTNWWNFPDLTGLFQQLGAFPQVAATLQQPIASQAQAQH
ncbi:MAG TPA: ester cyclase [Ktedonobacterales bacterium]